MRAGVPERVAMQLAGHKTRSVFERYNIVRLGDLVEAASKLNQFHGATGTNPGTVKAQGSGSHPQVIAKKVPGR